jgi:hypothetical protein
MIRKPMANTNGLRLLLSAVAVSVALVVTVVAAPNAHSAGPPGDAGDAVSAGPDAQKEKERVEDIGTPGADTKVTRDPCSMRKNPHLAAENEWTSCLSVSAKTDLFPAVGETAVIQVDVTSQTAKDTVDIQIDLPGNLAWVKVPTGFQAETIASPEPKTRGHLSRAAATRAFDGGQTLHFEGVFESKAAGATHI